MQIRIQEILSFFSYPSNIDWFCYIITKIHPPFQNPGSALETVLKIWHYVKTGIFQKSIKSNAGSDAENAVV